MKDKYIERTVTSAINKAVEYFSVITITGPQQSGKNRAGDVKLINYKNLDIIFE